MVKLISPLGFGLLFASYLGMIGRAGATSDQFFFSSSWGIALAGVATFAISLLAARKRTSNRQSFGTLAYIALGFGAALAGTLMRALDAAALEEVAGTLFGIGCFLMALAWTEIFAGYHFVEALRRGSIALCLGIAFQALMQLVPQPAAPFGIILFLGVSLVCALFEITGADKADDDVAIPTAGASLRSRILGLIKTTWAPLCGLGICAFLLGSLWMQSFPAGGGNPASAPLLDSIGPVLACSAIALASLSISTYEQTKRLFWIVMPITAAIFLITPSLQDLTIPHWNLLVANLQNAGSACMLLCSWALLLLGSRTNSLPLGATFGASLGLIGALPLLGAATFAWLGLAGNVITVVLFILYTCAVILFLALDGAASEDSTSQALGVFDAFIQSHCAKLAEKGSLTPREGEILVLLGRGHGYAYIAETFYISEATVRTHARNIYRKLAVSSQEELIVLIDGQA